MERRTIAKEDIDNLRQALKDLGEAFFILYNKINKLNVTEYLHAYHLCVSNNSRYIMEKYFSKDKIKQMGKVRSNILRASNHEYGSDKYNELLEEVKEDFDIIILDHLTHCYNYNEDNGFSVPTDKLVTGI